MQANMGTIDRVARAVVAVLIVGLLASGLVSGLLAFILGALAAVLGVTSVISFCPLYVPFGINTCQRSVRK